MAADTNGWMKGEKENDKLRERGGEIRLQDNISSAENQKGVIPVQRYSVENKKGALYSNSALLALNEPHLNIINILLARNWRFVPILKKQNS